MKQLNELQKLNNKKINVYFESAESDGGSIDNGNTYQMSINDLVDLGIMDYGFGDIDETKEFINNPLVWIMDSNIADYTDKKVSELKVNELIDIYKKRKIEIKGA